MALWRVLDYKSAMHRIVQNPCC